MKKILLSILTIALVSGAVVAGTRAYYSDTAKSSNNTFGSGAMNFRIARPGGAEHKIFNVTNMKPGGKVSGYFTVVNDSSDDLDMKWKAWVSGWNTGILDDVLEVKVTMKPDDYPDYSDFEDAGYIIAGNQHVITDPTGDGWVSIHDLGSSNSILAWNYPCKEEGTGDPQPFRVDWAGVYKIEVRMKETAGNKYQNSSFTGDLNFYATQCEAELFPTD